MTPEFKAVMKWTVDVFFGVLRLLILGIITIIGLVLFIPSLGWSWKLVKNIVNILFPL